MIYDIIIILFLFLFFINGWKKGFVRSIFSIVSIFVSVALVYLLQDSFFDLFSKSSVGKTICASVFGVIDNQIANRCSQAVMFGISTIVFYLLMKVVVKFAAGIMDFIANLPIIKSFNRIAGGISGILFGVLWIVIATNILSVMPETSDMVLNSYIVKFFGLIIV